jgi:DNA primase large subunit
MILEINENNEFYDSLIKRLFARMEEMLSGPKVKDLGLQWNLFSNWDIILYYLLAAINVPVFSNRFAMTCRDSYEKYLEGLPEDIIVTEGRILEIDMTYERDGSYFIVEVFNFTRYCSKISGPEYRLPFQTFSKGNVLLQNNAVLKLLRETLVSKIRTTTSSIDSENAKYILRDYKDSIERIRETAIENSKTVDLGEVDSSCFPPCIIHYINDVKNGVNLPHLARFTMVSFLNKVGMDENKIMEIFSTVPDFSKKVTEYQVKHIIGEISGINYTPPKCVTLRSNHLCYQGDDKVCKLEGMNHPLSYYRIKKKYNKKS